jgi:signal transduction histidine kinase
MTMTAVDDEIIRLQKQLGQERQARLAAEALADKSVHDLYQEKVRAEALAHIAGRLNERLDLSAVLTAVCQETARALDTPVVSISLYDAAADALVYACGHGLPADFANHVEPLPRAIYEEYLKERGHLVIVEDVQAIINLPNAELYRSLDIRTTANMSMTTDGKLVGRLNIATVGQVRHFTPNELELLRGLSNQAALALQNAQLFEALRQANERLELRVAERTTELRQANEQLYRKLVDNARLHKEVIASLADLRTLINASRDGIILISLAGRIRVVNEAALRLMNLPGTPGNWVNRGIQDMLRLLRQRAPVAIKAIAGEMGQPEPEDGLKEGDYEIPPRFVHWLNLPVVADSGPLGRFIVLRDVTEERLLQTMRDDLTHTMVHDLRNPLTSMITSLDMLALKQVNGFSPDQEQLMAIGRRSTQQMLRLVNAILDTTRLEQGEMPLHKSRLAIQELVEEVVHSQSVLAQEKRLRLEQVVSAGLPPVMADGELLRRVLQNLLGNAIKFTPDGGSIMVGARYELAAEGAAAAGGWLVVFVRDSGPGVPLELQNHLFQKFVTGRQVGHGSGLGLVFCRLAVEAHGGRAWVESEPGKGATFYFVLPVQGMTGPLSLPPHARSS